MLFGLYQRCLLFIWSGSLVDRLNKKYPMIVLEVFQIVLIVLFHLSFFFRAFIYAMLFFIMIVSSMHHSLSVTYIKKLIPKGKRNRFNYLRSLPDFRTFLTGSAIAGMIFIICTINMVIYRKVVSLFLSALLEKTSDTVKLSLKLLIDG